MGQLQKCGTTFGIKYHCTGKQKGINMTGAFSFLAFKQNNYSISIEGVLPWDNKTSMII
jgi:hypothetical protein